MSGVCSTHNIEFLDSVSSEARWKIYTIVILDKMEQGHFCSQENYMRFNSIIFRELDLHMSDGNCVQEWNCVKNVKQPM